MRSGKDAQQQQDTYDPKPPINEQKHPKRNSRKTNLERRRGITKNFLRENEDEATQKKKQKRKKRKDFCTSAQVEVGHCPKRSLDLTFSPKRSLDLTLTFLPHSPHACTHCPSPPQPAAEEDANTVAKLVLQSDPKTLAKPTFQWSPHLVDRVLKLLWHHGPKALQFFNALFHHPSYIHSPSSFDHVVDIAARMRDYQAAWALVVCMCSLRIGPTSKTLTILAECYASAGKAHQAVNVFLSMHHVSLLHCSINPK
ncbi:hypothetical protein Ahy_A10g048174 [Arachis hypogaea]|uniref:Pentatricopeptide repeat-containing protein n=1 Tax=Arachis hypogaea TaxID=3818 RepID=A0A445B4H7_ARAHY|nr:hypothetical protein Ahy_A10g048174 [Arachis hypogaea]